MFTYLLNFDQRIDLPCGVFYIGGIAGHHVLIDTGASPQALTAGGFDCRDSIPLESALLDAAGISTSEVDVVIMTHLHGDHTENLKCFNRAEIRVQEAEWAAVHNPPAAHRLIYRPETVENVMPTLERGSRADIFPGVHILSTPGHTPGSQSVVVDASEGRVIVCGICCNEGNLNPRNDLKEVWPDVLVPGIHTDAQEAYDNLLMIKREADYVITLHDPATYRRGICPGREWPRRLEEGDRT
jgi:glyoxylase-like metal-dependent hydrolase (beta-lactamase superfamily II)